MLHKIVNRWICKSGWCRLGAECHSRDLQITRKCLSQRVHSTASH
ncbi:hypothetical protein BPSOL_0673 [Bifidobacterium pseudolongum]|nr:hypothetical protein BPSOL_0673 [Bifidobacterium pseudolongum]